MEKEIKLTFFEWVRKQLTQQQVDARISGSREKSKYHEVVQKHVDIGRGKNY